MEPYQYNAHHDQETAPPIPNTIGMGMGMGMGIGIGGGAGGGGGLINSSKYSGSSSSSASSSSSSSMVCRQSSTRWIPTSEQIRILRDLYYNCGIRSPTSEQIQRISATLRRYGKIEGKNVFYWFQNHKARERQKKRLSVDPNAAAAAATPSHNKPVTAAASSSVSFPPS
uniref:Homeobox domain-containing protein n=1 Tax=Ananas comosus var. bracteatus TaxID=296719 RepID=A0A6V7NQ76_ANACO|nr:unnamed protein product [Ananas comosus var. bracteatus]